MYVLHVFVVSALFTPFWFGVAVLHTLARAQTMVGSAQLQALLLRMSKGVSVFTGTLTGAALGLHLHANLPTSGALTRVARHPTKLSEDAQLRLSGTIWTYFFRCGMARGDSRT